MESLSKQLGGVVEVRRRASLRAILRSVDSFNMSGVAVEDYEAFHLLLLECDTVYMDSVQNLFRYSLGLLGLTSIAALMELESHELDDEFLDEENDGTKEETEHQPVYCSQGASATRECCPVGHSEFIIND